MHLDCATRRHFSAISSLQIFKKSLKPFLFSCSFSSYFMFLQL